MPWLLLFAAIVAEVVATSTAQIHRGFHPPGAVGGGGGRLRAAFVLLSLCLKKIPVGVVYAVWSGSAWR
jgi:small multidrug resistance pump